MWVRLLVMTSQSSSSLAKTYMRRTDNAFLGLRSNGEQQRHRVFRGRRCTNFLTYQRYRANFLVLIKAGFFTSLKRFFDFTRLHRFVALQRGNLVRAVTYRTTLLLRSFFIGSYFGYRRIAKVQAAAVSCVHGREEGIRLCRD